MYWVHHLGCWVIILQFFWHEAPGIFILGATCMEFGGASQTLHLRAPESAFWDAAHVATMTLSHVASSVEIKKSRQIGPLSTFPRRASRGD